MSIKMMNGKKNQGHPCSGCPYVFTMGGTDCIMAAVPGECAWYFYKRLMGHVDAGLPAGEIQKLYRKHVEHRSGVAGKLEKGIRMLLEVAEMKYGKRYARHLEKKMERSGGAHEIERPDPCHG